MAVNPGKYRHLVTIREPGQRSGTPYGGSTYPWPIFVAGIWASIDPLVGFELVQAQKRYATATHRVRMRWIPAVKATMRIEHEDRTFEIVAPPLDREERHVELELTCREIES